MVGSYLGSAVPSRDIPVFAQWWREGRLPVDALVSSRIGLDDVNQAMDEPLPAQLCGRSSSSETGTSGHDLYSRGPANAGEEWRRAASRSRRPGARHSGGTGHGRDVRGPEGGCAPTADRPSIYGDGDGEDVVVAADGSGDDAAVVGSVVGSGVGVVVVSFASGELVGDAVGVRSATWWACSSVMRWACWSAMWWACSSAAARC